MYLISWLLCLAQCLSLVPWAASDCTLFSPNDLETQLLKRLDPIKGKRMNISGVFNGASYTYNLGICTDAIDDGKHVNVGMLQIDKTHHHVVGRYNATQLLGGDDWIFMKYKNGENYTHHCNTSYTRQRQAHIMLRCGPGTPLGEFSVLEENTDAFEECYYLFEIKTSILCPVPKAEGLGGGALFCILFFTFVGVYLIIGFLYQRIVVGAKGLEQIPNYSFWKEFGHLQADGCDFLCRCSQRQEMKMYRGIDDQLLNPERREEPDDRLLPM